MFLKTNKIYKTGCTLMQNVEHTHNALARERERDKGTTHNTPRVCVCVYARVLATLKKKKKTFKKLNTKG